MAAQKAVAVEDERNVAVDAAQGHAARTAVERGRDTAAVEQQDRFAAVFLDRSERGEQRRGERVARFAAQVDDEHRWQWTGEPPTEIEPLELPPALGARSRAAEDGDCVFERGTLRRHCSRVVTRIRLLLVGRVVFLVHTDDAEPRHGCEDRGARADDDRRVAARDARALVASLRFRQRRVEHRDALAEARAEPTDRLRREGDLRNEHDRAAAALECNGTGLQVDLGLTAPRCAVEEEVGALPRVECADDAVESRSLRGAELGRLRLTRQRVALRRLRPLAAGLPLHGRDQREP